MRSCLRTTVTRDNSTLAQYWGEAGVGLQTLPSSLDLISGLTPGEDKQNVLGMPDICNSEGVISQNSPVPSCLRS